MSPIEKLTTELMPAMLNGINRANEQARAAGQRVQDTATYAAAAGITGIARVSLPQVQNTINEIHAMLTNLGRSITETATQVAATPESTSPEQAITALDQAKTQLAAAHEGIPAAAGKVDEAQRLTIVALQGGDPGPIISILGSVKENLALVAQHSATAQQHLDATISKTRQTGNSGN